MRHPMIVEERAIARCDRLIETSRMVVKTSFYNHWMAHNLEKCQQFGILLIHLHSLRYFTFRLITSHLVIVNGWFYHHSTRLDETITTSYGTFFYDHWVTHNLTKREIAQ